MTRKEAALILGVRESAAAQRIKVIKQLGVRGSRMFYPHIPP